MRRKNTLMRKGTIFYFNLFMKTNLSQASIFTMKMGHSITWFQSGCLIPLTISVPSSYQVPPFPSLSIPVMIQNLVKSRLKKRIDIPSIKYNEKENVCEGA